MPCHDSGMQPCWSAPSDPLCFQTGSYSHSFCIEQYVLVTHDTMRSVFLYTTVVYIINNMCPGGRILFTCLFNYPIPSHLTQVIQQALNRQPSTAAAQYLQQMYAAQQQHLMLQTAALQQQHLSLAAVQQVGIHAKDIYSRPQKAITNYFL